MKYILGLFIILTILASSFMLPAPATQVLMVIDDGYDVLIIGSVNTNFKTAKEIAEETHVKWVASIENSTQIILYVLEGVLDRQHLFLKYENAGFKPRIISNKRIPVGFTHKQLRTNAILKTHHLFIIEDERATAFYRTVAIKK